MTPTRFLSSKTKTSCCLYKKATREITPIYWRKLIEVGVPLETARIIAWAIARYDQAQKIPDPYQQTLIRRNCHFVCRAELWRAELLLGPII